MGHPNTELTNLSPALLAQATPAPSLAPWMSFGLGGVLAIFLSYLVWHLITKTLPAQADKYANQINRIIEEHKVELATARNAYLASSERMETKFINALTTFGDRFERMIGKTSDQVSNLKDIVVAMDPKEEG